MPQGHRLSAAVPRRPLPTIREPLKHVPTYYPPLSIGVWFAVIALARLCSPPWHSFGIVYVRHDPYVGNKATGLLLFLYPFALAANASGEALYALCALASITAVEELAIQLTPTRHDGDRASLFSKEPVR